MNSLGLPGPLWRGGAVVSAGPVPELQPVGVARALWRGAHIASLPLKHVFISSSLKTNAVKVGRCYVISFSPNLIQSYLIILGEELGEFLIPPLRCFFLGDSADCWSSSTATTTTTTTKTV